MQRRTLLLAVAAGFAALLWAQAAPSAVYLCRAWAEGQQFDWGQVGSPGDRTAVARRPAQLLLLCPGAVHASGLPPDCHALQAPPWPLFRLGEALAARWLPALEASLLPPHLHALLLGTAFIPAKALYAATHLGIADELAGGPRSAEELADSLGLKQDPLLRVLRCLAAHGVFKEACGAACWRVGGLPAVGGGRRNSICMLA